MYEDEESEQSVEGAESLEEGFNMITYMIVGWLWGIGVADAEEDVELSVTANIPQGIYSYNLNKV